MMTVSWSEQQLPLEPVGLALWGICKDHLIKPTNLRDSADLTCKVSVCFRGVIHSFIAQSSRSTCSVRVPMLGAGGEPAFHREIRLFMAEGTPTGLSSGRLRDVVDKGWNGQLSLPHQDGDFRLYLASSREPLKVFDSAQGGTMSSWEEEKEGENEFCPGCVGFEGLWDLQWLPSGKQLYEPGLWKAMG